MKNALKSETAKISNALHQFNESEQVFKAASNEKSKLEELLKKANRNYIMCKYQFKSFIGMFIELTEHLLYSVPNKSETSENEYFQSQVHTALVEKLQGISKSIEDMELSYEISQVKSWKAKRKDENGFKALENSFSYPSPSRNVGEELKTGQSMITIVVREEITKAEKKKIQDGIMV